uniref:Uncharacterized protein n=1 Tax=Rhizophora mucronata TaxID=61149 RepID=A0A2P2NZM4_RHIMU
MLTYLLIFLLINCPAWHRKLWFIFICFW